MGASVTPTTTQHTDARARTANRQTDRVIRLGPNDVCIEYHNVRMAGPNMTAIRDLASQIFGADWSQNLGGGTGTGGGTGGNAPAGYNPPKQRLTPKGKQSIQRAQQARRQREQRAVTAGAAS